MKGLFAALWAEGLKVRRSKMFLGTILIFAFVAIMMGLLVFVVRHPEIAGRSAMVRAKSSVVGDADWPSFLNLLIQSVLALGPIGFGMVTAWVFGREYSDRVAKDLLALPVSRFTIVLAKFIITILWSIALAFTLLFAALVTGLAVHIPGWSAGVVLHAFSLFTRSAILTLLLCTPVAFIASASRGYLLAIAFAFITLILTNLVAVGVPNFTPYFPWAIPALCSGMAGGEALPHAGATSYVILVLTSILGFVGTAAWWRYADQT